MADLSTNLPLTEASDAAEVSLALETARALWAKGLALESVRWIHRAAENAESAGNDVARGQECNTGKVAEPAGLVADDQVWRWRMDR